jgi:hypothetical protein
VAGFEAMSALADLEAGRTARPRALLDRHCAAGFSTIPSDPVRLSALCLWAQVIARLGPCDGAQELLELLLSARGQIALDSLGVVGVADHHAGTLAGRLGDLVLADQLLASALHTYERVGARALTVHVELDRARLFDEDLTRVRTDAEALGLQVRAG